MRSPCAGLAIISKALIPVASPPISSIFPPLFPLLLNLNRLHSRRIYFSHLISILLTSISITYLPRRTSPFSNITLTSRTSRSANRTQGHLCH
ncbi:hypothetical protein BJ912DRAFT_960025 [Pholiota molesta]|nr:hypothetical protein BJ912DRAFT_960025 [Pholiota molesta]